MVSRKNFPAFRDELVGMLENEHKNGYVFPGQADNAAHMFLGVVYYLRDTKGLSDISEEFFKYTNKLLLNIETNSMWETLKYNSIDLKRHGVADGFNCADEVHIYSQEELDEFQLSFRLADGMNPKHLYKYIKLIDKYDTDRYWKER
ncbi:MAG: hypothetical protein ACI4CS_05800 [Candidatus Weimeria sp.]